MKTFLFISLAFFFSIITCFSQSDSLNIISLNKTIEQLKKDKVGLQNVINQRNVDISNKDADQKLLNKLIKEKEEVIKSLGEYLANCKAAIPTSITYLDKRVTDRKVIFKLKTNLPGFLKATLKGTSYTKTLDPSLGDTHTLIFDDLSSETEYKLETIVLDHARNETATKKSADGGEDRFIFTTLPPMSKPNTTIKSLGISHNEITLSLNSSEQNVLWIVEALVNSTSGASIDNIISKKGNFEVDSYNLPMKATIMEKLNDKNVTFSNLNPETNYYFRVKTINEAGYIFDSNLYPVTTKSQPVALDFDDLAAIELIYGPLETKFKWKAKGSVKKASVKVYLPSDENSRWVQTVENINLSNSIEVKIPFSQVQEILQKKSNKNDTPIAELSMTDEKGNEKKVKIQTQFIIPTKDEISKTTLGENQKKGIIEAGSKISGKEKVKWQDIVNIGLPVILSVL